MNRPELARFAAVVERWFGHRHDEAIVALEPLLESRAAARRTTCASYLERLGHDPDELRALAPAVTVGETYFYRHAEQLRAFAEVAAPRRLLARPRIEVLSAGCASGEEPYTLAMLLHERAPALRWRVTGIDINPAALERARRARYSRWAMRAIRPDLERWFVPAGNDLVLSETIREEVRFEEANLLDDGPLWADQRWDIVFCRNVLMYFAESHAQAVLRRIARSLAPGGFLFLGHAETIGAAGEHYTLQRTHGTFYHQRKGALGDPASAGAVREWHEDIAASSGRVQALIPDRAMTELEAAAPEPPPPSLPPPPLGFDAAPAPPPADPLSEVRTLVAAERFDDALDRLDHLPAAAGELADALLLLAVVQTHRGALVAAGAACDRLLARDPDHAGAWYQRAICHESAGDLAAAERDARRALACDPSFAMAHLRLGVLCRRAGDRATARAELTRAVELLGREPAERIALYGDGFAREALVQLCRHELAALATIRGPDGR